MRPRKPGRLLLAALALATLSACPRKDPPPKIEVCIGDGFGGADCIEADGSQKYRAPSELKNYWLTSQPDEANFASWCYQADPALVRMHMDAIAELVRK